MKYLQPDTHGNWCPHLSERFTESRRCLASPCNESPPFMKFSAATFLLQQHEMPLCPCNECCPFQKESKASRSWSLVLSAPRLRGFRARWVTGSNQAGDSQDEVTHIRILLSTRSSEKRCRFYHCPKNFFQWLVKPSRQTLF